ncbi:GAF domain-containing protein [Ramlibacter sp. MAH-25]|uniref:GAF domain-containing protein n=1 Tax=Ramlibacter pinisoli TaxID=2682844 RepID=A0A6N8IZ21_9BURK|nr:GAF domain-containing protein [Ramlibacter sp. CGMCC 1.13660]MVQ31832.1 GAF domain-containing protein [Ramlibacter pinisoli]
MCETLCEALGRNPDPAQALAAIEGARQALLGPGLLTVNLVATEPGDAPGEIHLQRGWSSDPAAYPVGGRKRKLLTPWTEQLLVRGEVFIGEGEGALASVFDDHARIAALGLQAVINVPLIEGGRCRATFNALGMRPWWTREDIAVVRLLALLAAPFALRLRPAP